MIKWLSQWGLLVADITCEEFSELEDEIKQEFYEDVVAAIADINACVSELEESVDESVIDRMFRAIHTVKGNCNMVFLTEFVNSAHQLEDLFSSVRSNVIAYNSVYGRFANQVVNQIQQQLKLIIEKGIADGDVLSNVKSLIDEVQSASDAERVDITEKAITAIIDGHFSIGMIVQDSEDGHAFSFMDATDIEFFEYISHRHQQNHNHHQFYEICSVLANKLNPMLAHAADEQQLHAAIIFLHLTQKVEPNGAATKLNIQQSIIASGLLSRMSGWSAAAELCIQAMEFHDGSGVPRGLKGSDISPAAQVLSLSFDFAFQILAVPAQSYKQALFSAVKNINSKKDTRYKGKLIQRFNRLIKTEYLTTKMF